jgi:prepilin-type N-terminal cleavage/methylation domain-containing protein
MNRGFTILELLIVIGLSLVLLSATLPIGLTYYRRQVADETSRDLATALTRARAESRLMKNDHAFGVKFLPGQFVYFEGDSYTSRIASRDEVHLLPGGGTISAATDEFRFSKISGRPSATGTATLLLYGMRTDVSVSERGLVSSLTQ